MGTKTRGHLMGGNIGHGGLTCRLPLPELRMRVYAAAQVVPVAAPPIADGAVAVRDGRIVAVGRRGDLLRTAGEARDLGHVALLPGLVNAHCHVELSWLGTDPPPLGNFIAW